MQGLLRKIKKTYFALKEKGIWFTYNLWWLSNAVKDDDRAVKPGKMRSAGHKFCLDTETKK